MLIDEEESADEHWDTDIYQIHEQLDNIKSYNENTISTDLDGLRDEESMDTQWFNEYKYEILDKTTVILNELN